MEETHSSEDQRTRALRLVLADEEKEALERTARLLEGLGHDVKACAESVAEACAFIAREDPDAAIVVVHDDPGHALDLVEECGEALSGPIVALIDEADAAFAQAAADRGVDALSSEASAEALQSALEVAMRRHDERRRLGEQVEQLEFALERRAVIERAKGALMERHGIGEREAFEKLRAEARSKNMTVVALAAQVTSA